MEDDPVLLKLYERAFTARGYWVVCASDGAEAIRVLESQDIAFVLADVMIPVRSGLEILRAAHAKDPSLPFVVATAASSEDFAREAAAAGAAGYLTKPVDLRTLMEVAEHAMRLRPPREEGASCLIRDDGARLEDTFELALRSVELAFQPIVRVGQPVTVAYEALMRPKHAILNTPHALLVAAERLDRVHAVGRRVRDRAALALLEAPTRVDLFVNLHPLDLLDPQLFAATAPLTQLAERVVLEVTERAELPTGLDVPGEITRLRSLGYRIALDDLGAGYAGLTSFSRIHPDVVKLDMALARTVHETVSGEMLRAMVALFHDMNVVVVGEGVETPDERNLLADVGCDLLQGYLFGRPAPAFETPHY